MEEEKYNSQEMMIYQTEDGAVKIDVKMADDTVWLSLDLMAELFQRDKSTISRHIKNIFSEGELFPDSVVANFATTASDGKNYQTLFYNLDAIISVGYRVNSVKATKFRIWATGVPQILANEVKIPLKTKKPRSHVAFLLFFYS